MMSKSKRIEKKKRKSFQLSRGKRLPSDKKSKGQKE